MTSTDFVRIFQQKLPKSEERALTLWSLVLNGTQTVASFPRDKLSVRLVWLLCKHKFSCDLTFKITTALCKHENFFLIIHSEIKWGETKNLNLELQLNLQNSKT